MIYKSYAGQGCRGRTAKKTERESCAHVAPQWRYKKNQSRNFFFGFLISRSCIIKSFSRIQSSRCWSTTIHTSLGWLPFYSIVFFGELLEEEEKREGPWGPHLYASPPNGARVQNVGCQQSYDSFLHFFLHRLAWMSFGLCAVNLTPPPRADSTSSSKGIDVIISSVKGRRPVLLGPGLFIWLVDPDWCQHGTFSFLLCVTTTRSLSGRRHVNARNTHTRERQKSAWKRVARKDGRHHDIILPVDMRFGGQ